MFIRANTIDDLMRECHQYILENGTLQKASRGEFQGVQGILLELTNPISRISRTETRGKITSCLGELIWILSGSNSLHSIAPYVSRYTEESEDGLTIYGGYGPRIFSKTTNNQFERTFEILKTKPSSRRAVIQILEPRDLTTTKKEIPCTLSLQFRILNNRLELITTMRSNDAFRGLPHDIFVFTMLQELMARRLGVELGSYKHFVGDLHIYSNDVKKIERFLNEGYASRLSLMPSMPADRVETSVQKLIAAEKLIREGCNPFDIKELFSDTDTYWVDLASFIGILYAKRRMEPENLKKYRSLVGSQSYKVYVKDRCDS